MNMNQFYGHFYKYIFSEKLHEIFQNPSFRHTTLQVLQHLANRSACGAEAGIQSTLNNKVFNYSNLH